MSDHKHTFVTVDDVIRVTCGCLRSMPPQEDDAGYVARTNTIAARILDKINVGGNWR